MPAVYNDIPIANIDPNFNLQIGRLKDQARRIYTSTLSGNDTVGACANDIAYQRKWQIPVSGNWDQDLFNISGPTGIGTAFDRTIPNLLYVRALLKGPPLGVGDTAPAGEGRVADCQAQKIQIDYLAVQERAFRMRHATSTRCSIHAAVRRRGHSPWNDAVGADAFQTDLGGGTAPTATDITGPVGGVFTSMIRYLLLTIRAGYNEGNVDITHGPTQVVQHADGTVQGFET